MIHHYYFVQQEHNDLCKHPYIAMNQILYGKTKIYGEITFAIVHNIIFYHMFEKVPTSFFFIFQNVISVTASS